MTWFRKKPDPISDRARALNQEIAALEAQIKGLDAELQRQSQQPRLRSTALPQGDGSTHHVPDAPRRAIRPQEPIFEEISRGGLDSKGEAPNAAQLYNELGVRKYDLPAFWRRIRNNFRGPATTNPKLVSYLAAGGIQGLKPLRYEKRIARNRFLVLVIVLFAVLLGLIGVFGRH